MERRLTAILAADVVGYSRLMGADEEGTLSALNTCRRYVDERIGSHGGRVFGGAGDSVIAEFSSPVEAVRCAVEIQQELKRRNAALPKDKQNRQTPSGPKRNPFQRWQATLSLISNT